MLKVLIIIFLIAYVIYKVGGFLFKSFFIGHQEAQRPYDAQQKHKPSDGNVYVDSQTQQKSNKDKDFKGGEYVDYEEVD